MTVVSPYIFAWGLNNNVVYRVSNLDGCIDLGMRAVTLAFYVDGRAGEIMAWKNDVVRHAGKISVTLSVGGASGVFVSDDKSVDQLAGEVVQLVDDLNVRSIDIDVEGKTLENKKHVRKWTEVVKNVVDRTGVDVSITVPVEWDGLGDDALNLVKSVVNIGVVPKFVNVMVMDFFTRLEPGMTWASKHIQVLNKVHSQLYTLGSELGVALDWPQIGYTPMIGVNDDKSVFTVAEWRIVLNALAKVNIGLVSFWAINRDQKKGSKGEYSVNTHSMAQDNDFEYIQAALDIL